MEDLRQKCSLSSFWLEHSLHSFPQQILYVYNTYSRMNIYLMTIWIVQTFIFQRNLCLQFFNKNILLLSSHLFLFDRVVCMKILFSKVTFVLSVLIIKYKWYWIVYINILYFVISLCIFYIFCYIFCDIIILNFCCGRVLF